MSQSVGCEKSFLVQLKERLKDCYLQEWNVYFRERVNENLNCNFFNIFQPEKYLSNCIIKPYRDILAKFRLKVSQLYCHRYKFTPSVDKTCPLCLSADETEIHFVLNCAKLEGLRKTVLPQHVLTNRNHQTLNILSSNECISFVFAKYLFHAMKLRTDILQTRQNQQ